MIYLDTETCGYHGPIVLIQYAHDDGQVEMWCPWMEPVGETLSLIEMFCNHEICGFNLAFDWFHINQMYNTLYLFAQKYGDQAYPIDNHMGYAAIESEARDGFCLKPVSALDLMMLARKGEYQSTMDRKDISITKIPMAIGELLCKELDERIPLKNVYFARKQDPSRRWRVRYRELENGEPDTEFVDVVLEFAPSSALKALALDALEIEESSILKFSDIEIEDKMRPDELGYAPFYRPNDDGKQWPLYIKHHVRHWQYNIRARQYAEKDVIYLQQLHRFFSAKELNHPNARDVALSQEPIELIPAGDVDSILCCMVGAVRWKGYAIDAEKIKAQIAKNKAITDRADWNMNSTIKVIQYLTEVMTETEKLSLLDANGKMTTGKMYLEELSKWKVSTVCEDCFGQGCPKCHEGLVESDVPHPVASRAQEIIAHRQAGKRVELLGKFLEAGRFHASFKVIGTLSSRMAGGDDLNAQGIPHEDDIRDCFPLAWPGLVLEGGDFSGFEVALADAAYGDPDLRADLQSGKKIHALFGVFLFPPNTYEEIRATDGLPGHQNLYSRSKQGVFVLLYGGEVFTLKTRVGVSEEVANEAFHRWCDRYKVWGEERRKIFDMFCSMRQPGGIGSKVEWYEPHPYIESMLGFRRYFTLENSIVKALYDLGEKLPDQFLAFKHKVVRRDREQTASGALRSALFGAAFKLQATNMRAAANHVIQSTGADLTKRLQANLWEIQPSGVSHWRIIPMNIHDEIMAPTHPDYVDQVTRIVDEFITTYKPLVPLLEIEWKHSLKSWAGKH